MQTMRRIGVQINGKLVGSCDSISKVSSPLFKDILDPWFDIEGFVPEKPSLNENQQNVLEWLKYPLNDIPNRFAKNYFAYVTCLFLGQAPDKVLKAYQELSPEQQLEVLAAFAEWEMEEVAE